MHPLPNRNAVSSKTHSDRMVLDTIFPATELNVRETLSNAAQLLTDAGVNFDAIVSLELAVAELLNNIVEHAYPADATGTIALKIWLDAQFIWVATIDRGVVLPGHRMPDPIPPNLEVSRDDLPEGQFGWFMIHKIADKLSYDRREDSNHVRLSIALYQAGLETI